MPGEQERSDRDVMQEAESKMDRALRSLRAELQKVRTGRASPTLLEDIQVDYYGTPTPLDKLATVSVPDARTIVVSPFDPGALAEIERAIQAADLGLTPSNDGKLVRVPIPPLTEERRQGLVKQVKKTSEEHKIGVRDARRSALSEIKTLVSAGKVPGDDKARLEKEIQEITERHVQTIDSMTSAKEQEILEV